MKAVAATLDSMKPQDPLTILVLECMDFVVCPACGRVSKGEAVSGGSPCAKCGVMQDSLFSIQHQWLETIFDCYRSEHRRGMCVLLFCVLIEQHMRYLIERRCGRLNIDWAISRLLLEKHQRVDELMKLFEDLAGISPKDALKGHPGAGLFEVYSALRRKRNSLAHGHPMALWEIGPDDIKAAVDWAAESFSCFAHLHGRFCAFNAPPLPNT